MKTHFRRNQLFMVIGFLLALSIAIPLMFNLGNMIGMPAIGPFFTLVALILGYFGLLKVVAD